MSDNFRTSYRILNPYRDDMLVYLTDTELKELREKRPEMIILKWHSPNLKFPSKEKNNG